MLSLFVYKLRMTDVQQTSIQDLSMFAVQNVKVALTNPTLSSESRVSRRSKEMTPGWRRQTVSSSWRPGLEHSSLVWLHR